jgi:excisionase family DNA binding protein
MTQPTETHFSRSGGSPPSSRKSKSQSQSAVATLAVEPLLVSLSDAARLLGVKIYSVRRLARKGVLPHRQIGNRWLIHFQTLKAFANGTLPATKAVR